MSIFILKSNKNTREEMNKRINTQNTELNYHCLVKLMLNLEFKLKSKVIKKILRIGLSYKPDKYIIIHNSLIQYRYISK